MHVSASELSEARWFASSYSNDQGGNCVEIADLTWSPRAAVAVRDSKNPDGPALLIPASAFSALVARLVEAWTP